MNNNLDIITSHLKGKPSEADIQEAAADAALQEEILFAHQMQFAQEHKEQIRVQNILKDIFVAAPPIEPDHELTEELAEEGVLELPTGASGTNKLWMWGIGSVIAIFLIYFISINPKIFDKETAEQTSALQKLTHLNSNTSYDTSIEKNDFSLGFEAYDKQAYKEAIPYFQFYVERHPKDTDIKLYLGISQLHAKKYKESLLTLQSLISTADSKFIPKHINWYMGVALLMDDRPEEAIDYFDKIQKDNPHYTSAKELLKQIKNQ